MKFLLAYLLKRPEKADRIQFFSIPDILFSTAYGISTRPEPYDLFMWYQTDADRVGKSGAFDPSSMLMILDKGADFSQYDFLIECVEYNRYSLAVYGEKERMDALIQNELCDLFFG